MRISDWSSDVCSSDLNAVYVPEYMKAIEVGVKSQLFDRRLQVNTSLYRNKYDNLQFQIFGPFGPQAFNADGATVQGIELEIRAAPTDWLQFDASGAYSDATFAPQVIQGETGRGPCRERVGKYG